MAFVGDVFRYFTSTVDSHVVTPVANRLASSVANPYVLSYFIWDRIKNLTPQRARDLSRLLSTAVTNAVGVLGADKAKQLAVSSRRLQDHVVAATVSPQGRDVILNSVATASKVAQAFNTPETKIATQQVFETLQSLIDFFASDNGRKILVAASECVTNVCEVAASPESAVLLAEVATNICHALDVEALRRSAAKATSTTPAEAKDIDQDTMQESDLQDSAVPRASTTSMEDTGFETESTMSEMSLMTPPMHQYYTGPARPQPPPQRGVREHSAVRSARIEKDVLLKMGVDPSMLDEVQRILDRLHEEQEREANAADALVATEGNEEVYTATDDEGQGEEEISSAFGLRSSSLPLDPEPSLDEETKMDDHGNGGDDGNDVILPEWHSEPVRNALRRRHAAAEERHAERHTFEDQSREMTELLARRRITHGELAPMDVVACRAISMVITVSFALFMLWLLIVVTRRLPF